MAVTHQPIFVQTPKAAKGRISAANTGRDGSGTVVTIHTAGANGALFKGLRVQAEVTTTAGVVRIFKQTAGAGNIELIKEILVAAVTPSTSVEAFSAEWYPTGGIQLGAGDLLIAATHNAEAMGVFLEGGGDY
jgi:hypothetical protein